MGFGPSLWPPLTAKVQNLFSACENIHGILAGATHFNWDYIQMYKATAFSFYSSPLNLGPFLGMS